MMPKKMVVREERSLHSIMACQMVLTVFMSVMMGAVAYFLYQDSDTMAALTLRVNHYMDDFDRSRVMELLPVVHNDFVMSWEPLANRTVSTMHSWMSAGTDVLETARREQWLAEVQTMLQEIKHLTALLNQTLMQGQLHVNVQL